MNKKLVALAVVGIFLFAFAIRSLTFFLQHWQGDQSQYVSLAMKYDALGLDGLNLDRVSIRTASLSDYPDWQIIYPALTKTDQESDLYRAYKKYGLEFNIMPLYHKSPLFPVVLSISHQWFAAPGQPFTVLKTKRTPGSKLVPFDRRFFAIQFWAVIVPLLSNLFTILLTYFFARTIFNERVALYSMFLLAIHPIEIVNAYKILTDDFVSFFVVAALFIFYISFERKNTFFAFVAGLLAGLSILAKQSAILILPSMAFYTLFAGEQKWWSPRAWLDFFRKPYFFCFLAGTIFISLHWFLRVYHVYGNAFFQPDSGKILKEDLTGWFGLLNSRPSAFMLFLINVPLLCPPFLLGHLTFSDFLKQLWPFPRYEEKRRPLLFLWFWVITFVLFFTFRIESREERYLLPVYPALAMLSGYGLSALQDRFLKHFSRPIIIGMLVGFILMLTVAWSVPIGLETVLQERFLILQPVKILKLFYARKGLTTI